MNSETQRLIEMCVHIGIGAFWGGASVALFVLLTKPRRVHPRPERSARYTPLRESAHPAFGQGSSLRAVPKQKQA